MLEGDVPLAVEHDIAAHLRNVELLGTPDLAAQGLSDMVPNHVGWCDGHRAFALQPEAAVAPALGIRKPEIWMPEMAGEALEVVRPSKGNDRDAPVRCGDLLVVLPQLREMLLTVESTEVAEQNQDGRPPEQLTRGKDLAIDGQQVEVEIDLQRNCPRRRGSVGVSRVHDVTVVPLRF